MKIAVFGATGLTGGLVVSQALAHGHDIVVLVRDPAKFKLKNQRLQLLQGDPRSPKDVEKCVQGVDAVIHCLGIGGKGDGTHNTLISDSIKAIISVAERLGNPRLVCMSNVGAGGSGTWFANKIIIPLFLRWLLPIIEDKNRMEAALRQSALDWVSVRLPNIVDGPIKPLRVSLDGRRIGLTITAASVAQFLLAQTTSVEFVCSTPSISN